MLMHPVISAIIQQLEHDLAVAAAASEDAHASATHSENVPENKYDTLALEAAYLAHGQSVRVAELQHSINVYRKFVKPAFTADDVIAVGAIVTLVDINTDELKQVFIGPEAGGVKVQVNGEPIQVLTPDTPLGKKLIGLQRDDEFSLSIGPKTMTYEVLSVS